MTRSPDPVDKSAPLHREESTTPDLVVLTRRWFEAANRRDVDAAASFYAPDAVHESVGMGASFEGVAAIREYLGDFVGAYDEFGVEAEQILDLGNGVTLAEVDPERILVLAHYSGRGKTSGLELSQMPTNVAALFHVAGGRVTRLVIYWQADHALADLGLRE